MITVMMARTPLVVVLVALGQATTSHTKTRGRGVFGLFGLFEQRLALELRSEYERAKEDRKKERAGPGA